ncbi:MAG: hypothetical protein JWN49_224 [Parcubacteria group bacterium]|nr:hypothetical protein [Parcubacteria group bacterium]
MPGQSKKHPPVTIVLGGTFAPEHYAVMVDTLTAILTHRRVLVQTFNADAGALAFLSEQLPVGDWKGVMVFLSGSRMHEADEIAAAHEDIRVVVITGMKVPSGRTALTQEPGKVFIIEKNAINKNIAGLILPS